METQRIVVPAPKEQTVGYLTPLSKINVSPVSLEESLSIGRDTSNQLVINDPYVSGRHARIERMTGGFVLRDLQSRNGTYVNGVRTREAVLTCHDRIRFGETVFLFTQIQPSKVSQLTSKNPKWQEQLERIPSFAVSGFPVLIIGPSGSGKEILARSIHAKSARQKGPFIGINCGALNESLIESELFGHVKGSFTGATHDRKGAFEAARGGTLFLDEIGDLPLSLQPKLLRALENNEIRPVGSDRIIETDTRIVAATHKNLALAVKAGRFREDLYYRLNVCQLHPPPLIERMEDFEDLLFTFAKQYRVRFSLEAIRQLKKHKWPGNIRELKNAVTRASAYFPGKYIQAEDLKCILDINSGAIGDYHSLESEVRPIGQNISIIKEIEREMIIRRLVANKGNQRQTAKDLGIPKSTLHDRIKNYSIDVEKLVKSGEENFTL